MQKKDVFIIRYPCRVFKDAKEAQPILDDLKRIIGNRGTVRLVESPIGKIIEINATLEKEEVEKIRKIICSK